jgi:glucokinase
MAIKMKENRFDVNCATSHAHEERGVILAGDLGATKTLLGLFDAAPGRPRVVHVREFHTTTFASLTEMIAAYSADEPFRDAAITGGAFGVAGPVLGETAQLTNVPFAIDAPDISRRFGIPRVSLLNDLEAMAYAMPVLDNADLHVLQAGVAGSGNMALIGAGTGLGEALLHRFNGRFIPSPTEAGHADWAARTDRDVAVLRLLVARYGRAEVEHVVSGRGLANLHRATHHAPCDAGINADDPTAPAALTRAALDGRCAQCVEALGIFVDAYGAEAGNLALRSMATGCLFIGGGIAPKILPALTDGRFMRAFLDKGPMRSLVEQIPVKVVLEPDAGLLGAAVFAAGALP